MVQTMEGLEGVIPYIGWPLGVFASQYLQRKTKEPDPQTGSYRWLIQAVDPCECTAIGMGGLNTFAAYRPYKVTYYDTFLISSDPEEIKKWLNCSSDPSCSEERPLGMEDGRIPDVSITASSVWKNSSVLGTPKARLSNSQAWCNAGPSDNISPWIQVDFTGTVTVTGLITQGRGDSDQWVTKYHVTYSDDAQSWNHVTDADGRALKFHGNWDRDTRIGTRFPVALRTRILRIHPNDWYDFCCMRFEVIGRY